MSFQSLAPSVTPQTLLALTHLGLWGWSRFIDLQFQAATRLLSRQEAWHLGCLPPPEPAGLPPFWLQGQALGLECWQQGMALCQTDAHEVFTSFMQGSRQLHQLSREHAWTSASS